MIVHDGIDALDLSALIRAGDSVVCGQGVAEPVALTRALIGQRGKIGPIDVFIGPTYGDTFGPSHGDFIAFKSYCGTARNALLHAARILDPIPAHYSDLGRLFARGVLRCEVALMTLGPPDEHGRFNLGLVNDYIVDAARKARVVIAEVSDRWPWVHGAELPADIHPHVIVRSSREPVQMPRVEPGRASEEERVIASRVASLIPDGATLELGIGTLPDLVLDALRDHRDLGIHSGVLGDGVARLMELGIVNNARKPMFRGTSVAGLLMGSRRLLDFAHRNEAVLLAGPKLTHDIGMLRALRNFFAINGAIEIDLSGQVNAESVHGRYIGAVGGQVDFVRGANGCAEGRSIMLLQSTARNGTASRIVPRLADATVTTARSDVDVVVTEHGVAELRGKSLRERAAALAAIAHPDFREQLMRTGRDGAALQAA
ncbi:acetyl-CoA hydrolase/transferase family protein [Caballeronia ptereochthonis]|uniref:Acetyl-CoA hydrolase/transferase n=1 Tax=Caballeronia ptereochthonis TaxID=1777144 RepID=A0A158E2I4_9BURK|nr:acetyl-CoA hydrolase/transferase C-terminal domain-containing protein [Caballeronia ptereochthonis]SAL00656.1 Acetyl-CoA hydrolase/transferase [Caballeronia ptereochthonis]